MSGQNTRLPVAGRKHHAQKTKTKAGNKEKNAGFVRKRSFRER